MNWFEKTAYTISLEFDYFLFGVAKTFNDDQEWEEYNKFIFYLHNHLKTLRIKIISKVLDRLDRRLERLNNCN